MTRITVYRNQKQMLTFEVAVTNEKCKELLDAIADYIGRYYTTDCKRVSVYNGDAEYFFELNPVDMRVYNSAYGLTKSEPRVSLFVGYPNPKRKKGVSKIYISGTKKQVIGELYAFIRACFPKMHDSMLESLLETDLESYYERTQSVYSELDKEFDELIAELERKITVLDNENS